MEKMTEALSGILEQYVKLPEIVQLKLPQLKKITLPPRPEIK
jgi:hypothetical protein